MKTTKPEFIRYLTSKKEIDDLSLNRTVRDELLARLICKNRQSPLRVLELGAGIGTMLERLSEWGLLISADYTAVDVDADCILEFRKRLDHWARRNSFGIAWRTPEMAAIQFPTGELTVTTVKADIDFFFEHVSDDAQWDLGLAHAFMDLVNLSEVVPRFCRLIRPGGLLYLTLNYDGETIFLPALDSEFEKRMMTMYNLSMDHRTTNGKRTGDSKTGRQLLTHLLKAKAVLLAAGSSDWIVFAGSQGYTRDQVHFLHFVLHTVYSELQNHPAIGRRRLDSWLQRRLDQIDSKELIFIARQLDVLARIPDEDICRQA